ncbi:MAG: DNA methyltransferase [archaeon]
MKKIFLLSKQNIPLAKSEVLALTSNKKYRLHDNLLVLDATENLASRLGYTHSIYDLLFSCRLDVFKKKLSTYDWNKVYSGSFCVRVHGNHDEKEVADIIYDRLNSPKVNLKNPKSKYEFFFIGNLVIAGRLSSDVDKSYLMRKAHKRPMQHPTSMHPALARVCINLTGLHGGTIIDPFCGSGGILIEAGLMGLRTIGTDIDKNQIMRAKRNIDFFNVRNCRLKEDDATKLKTKADAIVTDLPYGKSSKAGKLSDLYSKFLLNSPNISKNMVIVMPDFVDYKKIIKNSKWKIKSMFKIYVHRSLSRIVLKLAC